MRQLSERQRSAMWPRSSTACSMPMRPKQWLSARPAWPAPTLATSARFMVLSDGMRETAVLSGDCLDLGLQDGAEAAMPPAEQ